MDQPYKRYVPMCDFKGGRSINVELHDNKVVTPLQESVEEISALMHCVLSTRGLLNGSLPGNYGENGVLGEVCPETVINNFFAPGFQPGHKPRGCAERVPCRAQGGAQAAG